MGHNHTFCHDLHNHTDIEIAVQKRVNTFEMYGEIMTQVPTVIYAVLAGSLSDRFGRGPLLFLPIIGQILEGVALLVNKIWFTELPLEALWLANIYDWFGGSAVWYLGVYTFAADITSVEQRASRMARFDGFEQMAFIVGTALSPVLFRCAGYEGAFSIKIALAAVSLGIVSKVLWSNTYKGEELQVAEKGQELSKWQEAKEIVLGMAKTVFKKRRHWVTLCILLQIAAYTMYYLSFGSCRLTYLYTRKTLGWQQQEYIALKTLRKSLGIIILMLLIPFLKMFHISDINLLIICNLLNGLGFLLASISMFYMPLIFIGTILIPFQFPKYALARSLLSQSVEKSEVGRIFSCLALISALVKFVSGPMYAIIYDQTLASFPGTFMMVTSLIIFMAMAIMMIVKCLIRYQVVEDDKCMNEVVTNEKCQTEDDRDSIEKIETEDSNLLTDKCMNEVVTNEKCQTEADR